MATAAEPLHPHHSFLRLDATRLQLPEVLRRMRRLSGPEQEVLSRLLGLDGIERSVHDVARELGLSSRQVRAIEGIACSKLRHPSTAA